MNHYPVKSVQLKSWWQFAKDRNWMNPMDGIGLECGDMLLQRARYAVNTIPQQQQL